MTLVGADVRSVTIEQTSVVYQGDEPALFPGLTRAANGDILASFCTRFDCLPGGEAFVLRSRDGGQTWEPPTRLARSRKPGGCINLSVGMTVLRDGTVFYPCCDARLTRKWDQHDAELLMLRSTDHGATWATARVSTDVLEPFAYGKILELRNGDLLCPIWGKAMAEERWRSGVLRSRDGGRRWGEHVTIGYDPAATLPQRPGDDAVHCAGFNETTLAEQPDGVLLAVLRQQGVEGGTRELYRAYSADNGRTWSEPVRMPLWGTSPSAHVTPNGTVLLGYRCHRGNPQSLPAAGLGISVSHDAGRTWSEHLQLRDPRGRVYEHEFEVGYPAFLDLPDFSILVLFYSYDPGLPAERYLAANILRLH